MNGVKEFIGHNFLLIPLGVLILVTIAMAYRKDRRTIIFKKRSELNPEEKRIYYSFHILKYVAIVLGLFNPLVK